MRKQKLGMSQKPKQITDDDGFIKVVHKGRKGQRKKPGQEIEDKDCVYHESNRIEGSLYDHDSILQRLHDCRLELEQSDYLKKTFDTVDTVLSLMDTSVELLVCYGLGNFTSCLIARYQLAFMVCLRDKLKMPAESVQVYDPQFTTTEIQLLTKLNFYVININEEGKRHVVTPTLFYMPHCGKPLYNNLLWKNWGPGNLCHLVVVGNSFSGIKERTCERELKEQFTYIYKIIPFCDEVMLDNSFRFGDIFNDTAVHSFPRVRLKSAADEMWEVRDEPCYPKDVEIIQNT